jgi:hypothetical protein
MAVTTLSGTYSVNFAPSLKKAIDDIDVETVAVVIAPKVTYAAGSSNTVTPSLTKPDEDAAFAQEVYGKVRTLAAGGTETLDLSGVLADAFGTSIVPASVKGMIIRNRSTDCSLLVGGAGSNGFTKFVGGATHQVKVWPRGFAAFSAPGGDMTVVAGTGDQLLMTAGSEGTSGVSYAIGFIFG